MQKDIGLQLNEMRLSAFSEMRTLANAKSEFLAACGYRGKSNAEAVYDAFIRLDRKIEKALQAWEKANPLK